ncbi:unnamed protein product [Urochloa humidicola]
MPTSRARNLSRHRPPPPSQIPAATNRFRCRLQYVFQIIPHIFLGAMMRSALARPTKGPIHSAFPFPIPSQFS